MRAEQDNAEADEGGGGGFWHCGFYVGADEEAAHLGVKVGDRPIVIRYKPACGAQLNHAKSEPCAGGARSGGVALRSWARAARAEDVIVDSEEREELGSGVEAGYVSGSDVRWIAEVEVDHRGYFGCGGVAKAVVCDEGLDQRSVIGDPFGVQGRQPLEVGCVVSNDEAIVGVEEVSLYQRRVCGGKGKGENEDSFGYVVQGGLRNIWLLGTVCVPNSSSAKWPLGVTWIRKKVRHEKY